MALTVATEYAWVLLMAVLTALQCQLIGWVASGTARRRFFGKKFFATHFPELKRPPEHGYPDQGCGKFAEKLSMEDWIVFNSYQRAHQNFLEKLPATITFMLAAGVFYTRLTVILSIIHFVGRIVYARGYIAKGGEGRKLGVVIADISMLVMLGAAVTGVFVNAGGVSGLLSFVLAGDNKA